MTAITHEFLLSKWFHPVPVNKIKDKYFIEESGNIFSIQKQMFLNPQVESSWYIFIKLTTTERNKPKKKPYSIARMVCTVFNGTKGITGQVNHKDLNKVNNHYTNLEFISPAQNSHHRLKNWWGERKTYQETRQLLDEQQRIFRQSEHYLEIMAYLV